MTSQKRLSRLTIAAAALFAASIPCVAQTAATKSRIQPPTAVTEQAVAMREDGKVDESLANYNVSEKTTADTGTKKQQSGFSTARFMDSVVNKNLSFSSDFDLRPVSLERSKTEFTEPGAPKKISFVPSRGQKIPE